MGAYETTPPPDRIAERIQIRTAFTTESGTVVRFVTQLEYWHRGTWTPVVRYDHDSEANAGHGVNRESLHRDVFRDGEKYRVESVTGPIRADEAFQIAEEDLRENVERYVRRFERWHGIRESDR